MWPVLVAVGAGAVLVYEKAGDWINEWRGVAVQPIPSPVTSPVPAVPVPSGVLWFGAGLLSLWLFLTFRKKRRK